VFEPLPQVKRNVAVEAGDPLKLAAVRAAIQAGEAQLGAHGRLIVRRSGTEKMVRVMAEGDDETLIGVVADSIVRAVRDAAA
jgi:phosphoglucosamine mutase